MQNKISEDDNIFLPDGFIENTDNDKYLIYADTDSAYLLFKLPFTKFGNPRRLVEYIQNLAVKLDSEYNRAVNNYLGAFCGLDPKYNTMKFKSEVIGFRGFWGGKKFYSIGVIWDEGTYYDEDNLYLKRTGGQAVKSDVTKITAAMLSEVYYEISINRDNTNITKLEKIVCVDIVSKYRNILEMNIDNFEISEFSIPKKWGMKAAVRIPKWVFGARLFNTFISDEFRPGDSFVVLKIYISNKSGLKSRIESLEMDGKITNFMLKSINVNSKLDEISLPTNLTPDIITKIKTLFKEFDIYIARESIIDFNIDMKIKPFLKLFEHKHRYNEDN